MDTNAPAPKPDMLEQLKRTLERYSNGDDLAKRFANADRDSTLVLASAVVAVVAELRDIHNVLHEINGKLADQERAAVNQLREEIGSLRVAQGHLATILGQALERGDLAESVAIWGTGS